MAPILAGIGKAILMDALPQIVRAIPRLGAIFGAGQSEVAQRNVKALEVVADVASSAMGATNAQEMVEALQDKDRAEAARAAVDRNWATIVDLVEAGGGGIDGARKAAREYAMPDGPRFWLNPSFWISLILLTMPMMLLVDVFYVHPESYTGEIRTQIVTGVLLVIGMVGGYWIGTSFSSAKKDERARS